MNDVIEYVISSVGWSLVGFVGGWLVASLRSDVTVIREAVVHDDEHIEHEHELPRRADIATRVLGIVVALLAIVTVVQGVVSSRRDAEIVDCQTDFNTEFARVVSLRSELTDADRDALENLMLTLNEQANDRAARREAFDQYVDTIRATRAQRAEHPLPELPKGECK